MAAGTAGKKARLKVATVSAGPYTAVQGVKSWSHSIDGANVDDSEMGVDWVQRVQGLKDGKISISGQRRVADATGQNVFQAQLIAGSSVFVQALPDGGTTAGVGFQQEMYVSSFKSDAAVDGIVNWSVELEGNGAITLV
jgi:predicted secreted protein